MMHKICIVSLLLLSCMQMAAHERTQLLIVVPTRSRPQQLFQMLDSYYAHLSGQVSVCFLVSCDTDDTTMNCSEVINRLKAYPHLICSFAPNKSKIEAFNRDLNLYDFDMVLGTADDTEPYVQGFDKIIVDAMYQQFPDLDGVLNIFDGHVGEECNTLPIIGKKFFDRFGYFYHPDYKALVCDMEITNVSRMLKREYVIEEPLIIHNHPAWTFAEEDALYKHNEQYHNADVATFYRRRAAHYDLSRTECEAVATKVWSILLAGNDRRALQALEQVGDRLQQQVMALGLQEEIEILMPASETNEHLSRIRNRLLNASSGSYVQFIGADDSIDDHFIERIYNEMQQDADCIPICGSSIALFNPIKRWIAIQFPFYPINDAEKDWLRKVAASQIVQTKISCEKPSLANGLQSMVIFV